jgi:tetratricopeptide (TPR) repeat protein
MARTAIDQCDAVPDHPSQENWEAIGLALTLAEGAVDAAPNDATAHFAVFCSLAKQTALRGFSLQSLLAVHRLHSEIDTALRLDPGYGDALVAKGAFLLNLPRLLGGDAQAAASTLQRAVALEPQRISARLYLAEALESLGSRREAKQQAQAALDAALQAGRQEQADAARALLERLAEQ